MAKDAGDMIGSVLGTVVKELAENVPLEGIGGSDNGNGHHNGHGGALSGARGVATGAALAGAVPLAGMAARKIILKRVGNPIEGAKEGAKKLAGGATDKVGKGVKEAVGEKVEEATDAPGLLKSVGKRVIPGLGGGDTPSLGGEEGGDKTQSKKGVPGVGKGRRMPVQQEVDVGVPLTVVYNQWTQFEEWPQFMHRLDQATQEDDCTVSFRTKIWGKSKEFTGQIVEQRPDERIQWTVDKGVAHTGVVFFHELAPRLTRVQVNLDVEPGSLLEKAARGMRHVKRAVRADLHRFKAFIEMQEEETGAWRGEIHDGELVQKQKGSNKPRQGSSSRSPGSSSGGRSRTKKRPKSRSRQRGSPSRSGSSNKAGSAGKRSPSRKSGSSRKKSS
jgi:uncharacterized membrane protein